MLLFQVCLILFAQSLAGATVPENRSNVKPGDFSSWCAWAFFGNDDDGIYGEKPTAGQWSNDPIGPKRAVKWWLRNPMHNFTFYVIGSADRQNSEYVILEVSEDQGFTAFSYRPKARTVFAGRGTGFFLGFHGGKPFLSLRLDYGRRLDFYCGWRERGNFGLKFNPAARSLRLKHNCCYPRSHG